MKYLKGMNLTLKSSVNRIIALDYLKGIAIFYVTFGHIVLWCREDWYASGLALFILSSEFLGVSLFLSITVMGTAISIKRKQFLGKTKGMFKNALKKSMYLFIIGEIMNLIIDAMNTNKVGAWHVLGMNMITDVAFVQLLTYGLVKMPKSWRFALLLLLIILYPFLLSYCLVGMNYDNSGYITVTEAELTQLPCILYYLLFDFDAMSPMMSWMIIAVLASIIFDSYFNLQGKLSTFPPEKQEKYKSTIIKSIRYSSQKLFIIGILLILISVLAGGTILFKGIGITAWIYKLIINCDVYCFFGNWQGLPMIIIRHTPNSLIFNLGMFTILFSAIQHVRYVKSRNLFLEKIFVYLGQYSFSIFLYGHTLTFLGTLSLAQFIIVEFIILIGLLILVPLWAEKGHGIGSLEWGMAIYSKMMKIKN